VTRVWARDSCWGPLRESASRAAPWQLIPDLGPPATCRPCTGAHARAHSLGRTPHAACVRQPARALRDLPIPWCHFRRLSELCAFLTGPCARPPHAQVGTRNITDTKVSSGYLLPTVGPLADPEEAAAKARALEVRAATSSALCTFLRVSDSQRTPATCARTGGAAQGQG
jgi:hypothetical protein